MSDTCGWCTFGTYCDIDNGVEELMYCPIRDMYVSCDEPVCSSFIDEEEVQAA